MVWMFLFCCVLFNFRIGRLISTKAIGSTFRDDITEFYKYPEGKDNYSWLHLIRQ